MFKIGKYNIISLLGKGTFGEVYKAEYQNNYYALKTYDPFKRDAIKDLKKEYKIGKKIRVDLAGQCHPLIVCIYEKGTTTINNLKLHYLVMEYIEGNELQKIIDVNRKWTFITDFDILKLMNYLIRGVHFLHSQKIIHMDIKPLNIIFNKNELKLKIIDMGLACLTDFNTKNKSLECYNKIINYGYIVGTKNYLSPEMYIIQSYINTSKMDKIIDDDMYIKNDIWALGITFAELCNQNVSKQYPDSLGLYIAREMEKGIYNDISFNSITYSNPIIKEIIEGCLKTNYTQRLNTQQLINILNQFFGEDVHMT